MNSSDRIDEELDWERWIALTEGQQDAEIERTVEKYRRALTQLPLAKLQRHRIQSTLETCRGWRRIIILDLAPEFGRRKLKQAQFRLLKLRVWRQTGTFPGEA